MMTTKELIIKYLAMEKALGWTSDGRELQTLSYEVGTYRGDTFARTVFCPTMTEAVELAYRLWKESGYRIEYTILHQLKCAVVFGKNKQVYMHDEMMSESDFDEAHTAYDRVACGEGIS